MNRTTTFLSYKAKMFAGFVALIGAALFVAGPTVFGTDSAQAAQAKKQNVNPISAIVTGAGDLIKGVIGIPSKILTGKKTVYGTSDTTVASACTIGPAAGQHYIAGLGLIGATTTPAAHGGVANG